MYVSENTPSVDELLEELKSLLDDETPAKETAVQEAPESEQKQAPEEDSAPVENKPVKEKKKKKKAKQKKEKGTFAKVMGVIGKIFLVLLETVLLLAVALYGVMYARL